MLMKIQSCGPLGKTDSCGAVIISTLYCCLKVLYKGAAAPYYGALDLALIEGQVCDHAT